MQSSASPRMTAGSVAEQAARDTAYLGLGLLTSSLAGMVRVTGLSLRS